jgi:uncharacterized damage-inducible protein DinB
MENEAWLEGPLENVLPILMPAAHALVQAARDVNRSVSDLTQEELLTTPNGAPSVAFHLLHISGSIDRLLTYTRGERLTENQFSALKAESEVGQLNDPKALVPLAIKSIERAISVFRVTPEETLFEKRVVGRRALPTTVFGLLFHIAEHTQRHIGQIISTSSVVRHKK